MPGATVPLLTVLIPTALVLLAWQIVCDESMPGLLASHLTAFTLTWQAVCEYMPGPAMSLLTPTLVLLALQFVSDSMADLATVLLLTVLTSTLVLLAWQYVNDSMPDSNVPSYCPYSHPAPVGLIGCECQICARFRCVPSSLLSPDTPTLSYWLDRLWVISLQIQLSLPSTYCPHSHSLSGPVGLLASK